MGLRASFIVDSEIYSIFGDFGQTWGFTPAWMEFLSSHLTNPFGRAETSTAYIPTPLGRTRDGTKLSKGKGYSVPRNWSSR